MVRQGRTAKESGEEDEEEGQAATKEGRGLTGARVY